MNNIYLEAAQLLEEQYSPSNGHHLCACTAIRWAIGTGANFGKQYSAFSDYFKPEELSIGDHWFGPSWRGTYKKTAVVTLARNKDTRIMALLLMHEIINNP